jgi:methionyl aminopeptidase
MILTKTPSEITKIKKSARILSEIMRELKLAVRPGISANELNQLAEKMIQDRGAQPSFKNYRGFPAALCVSTNEMVVHGSPTDRRIQVGDIVSLDLGVFYQGFHADMAVTVPVNPIDKKSERLIYVTEEALMRGIEAVRPGGYLGDIGYAISHYVWREGFDIVKELCGHGIGRSVHEEPDVLNFGKKGEGLMIRKGMVLCIEPIVTIGRGKVRLAENNTGYVTEDGSRSAHFEHTVALTEVGLEILT